MKRFVKFDGIKAKILLLKALVSIEAESVRPLLVLLIKDLLPLRPDTLPQFVVKLNRWRFMINKKIKNLFFL